MKMTKIMKNKQRTPTIHKEISKNKNKNKVLKHPRAFRKTGNIAQIKLIENQQYL